MAKKKRSDRLALVQDLAEKKRKAADQMLAQSKARITQGEAQLAQLREYKDEYHKAFEAQGRQGLTLAKIDTYQAFITKLALAIEQQVKALEANRQELKAVEQHWARCYAQEQGMTKLVDKSRDDEQRAEEKKLQAALDERAQLIPPRPM
ncbi:MAG: flagellar export protein FliJ [Pontibacterium sp.]